MENIFNIHNPIYLHIEEEVVNLTYSICFDDDQLNVYSTEITDLILRIMLEIEAISLEIYNKLQEKPKDNISYATALKEIMKKHDLCKIQTIIILPSCYFTDKYKIFKPFSKWKKGGEGSNKKIMMGGILLT